MSRDHYRLKHPTRGAPGNYRTTHWAFVAPLLLFIIASCAGIPENRGFDDVEAHLQSRGLEGANAPEDEYAEELSRLTERLLSQPLTVDAAVEIALLNNPVRHMEYARLGIAQADLYDAVRLQNPTLSAAALDSDESGAANQVSLGLAQNLSSILIYSARKRFATGETERIKYSAAANLQKFSADVEGAYYRYASAIQIEEMRGTIAGAADVSARLAQRFHEAGNVNRLELNRELAAATQATIEADRAALEAEVARNELSTLMGLGADREWKTINSIPLPVAEEDRLSTLVQLARDHRLDIEATRLEVSMLEDALGVTRRFRALGDVEVAVEYERETDRSRLLGPALSLELPIFNMGEGKVLRAQAMLETSQARLKGLEMEAENAVVLAHKKVQASRKLVDRIRLRLIPQRQAIVQSTQELQNYMILGQFELLTAKQEEYDSYQSYLEAVRDYWLARVELAREVGTTLPSSQAGNPDSIGAESLVMPRSAHGGHEGHRAKAPARPQQEEHQHGARDGSGSAKDNMDGEPTADPETAPPVNK